MVTVAASSAVGTGVGSSTTAAQESTTLNASSINTNTAAAAPGGGSNMAANKNLNSLDSSPKSFALPSHNVVSREPHQAQWRYQFGSPGYQPI